MEKSQTLEELDIVIVKSINIHKKKKSKIKTSKLNIKPAIGDIGTIVHKPLNIIAQPQRIIVESVDKNGSTIWISDFTIDEIEIIFKSK